MQKGSGHRICIIGAGLTGLVAAYRLSTAGFKVAVLESTLEPGGMTASFSLGSGRLEYIYHHMFTSDTELEGLAAELGLAGRIVWHKSREAIYSGKHLYPFATPLDLLCYRPIPLLQRLATGLAVLKAGRLPGHEGLENQTASEWLCREGGAKAYEQVWRPLLQSKFDRDAGDVSAVWIWNKFRLRGGSRNQGGRSVLGYMDGSFGLLVDALIRSIQERGGRILFGHTAMNISHVQDQAGSYRINCVLDNSSSVRIYADAVIATISSRQFANITAGLCLPEDYQSKVRSIRYKGNLCLVLRLNRQLSPYYWTTICADLPFVAVVEHTNLTSEQPYEGHIVYLSRYLDVADPLWMRPDGEIFSLFTAGLAQIYPDFGLQNVIDWRLRRTRYAQPVIVRNYSQIMPGVDTPDPGVKLAGMAQIYPEDRGMNYAVRLGGAAASSVLRYLRERPVEG